MDYPLKYYFNAAVSTVIVTIGLYYSPYLICSSDRTNPREVRHPVGVVVSNPLEKKREKTIIQPIDDENLELKKSLQRFEKTGKELREDLERLLEQSRRKED